jgi:hypothetical protein
MVNSVRSCRKLSGLRSECDLHIKVAPGPTWTLALDFLILGELLPVILVICRVRLVDLDKYLEATCLS